MTARQRGTAAYSLPDSKRKSPRESIPFDRISRSALAHIMRTRPTKAAAVRDAVCHLAREEGWVDVGEDASDKIDAAEQESA